VPDSRNQPGKGGTMNAARMAATQLIDAGVVPLSLYEGTKKPIGDGWQNNKMPTVAQLADLFPDHEPRNIGALLGQASGNIFSPDFDVYPAFARWQGEYKPDKTHTVFSSRSTRPIYYTEPEALAKGNMVLDGVRIGELLADGQHVVMPPSRLKDGFEYTDNGLAIAYMPPDHPAFLALIKLTERHYSKQVFAEIAQGKRKLARFAAAALAGRIPTGKRYPTRSELDAAIIQSLARSGFDTDEIYVKLDTANLRSHWHERKESSRRAEIARVIAKFAGTNSPMALEALKRADALAEVRQGRAWAGYFDTGKTRIVKDTGEIKPIRVAGRTVEAVLLAHETKVRDCLTFTYHLDARAGDGRFTNMGWVTFTRATQIIVKQGLIKLVKGAKGTCASVYELLPAKKVAAIAKAGNDTCVTHFNTVSGGTEQDSVEVCHTGIVSAGVFDYAGLGRAAFMVYRAALNAPITAKAIAAQTGLNVQTVRHALKCLARYGLTEKQSGRRWLSDANVNWQAVGDYLNTTQVIKAKQQRTQAAREARANSYKHHAPERAAHSQDKRADTSPNSLGHAANRAKAKAANNVKRYGANAISHKK